MRERSFKLTKTESTIEKIEKLHKEINDLIDSSLSAKEKFKPTFEKLADDFCGGKVEPSKKCSSVKGIQISNLNKNNDNPGVYYFYLRLTGKQKLEDFKDDWAEFKKDISGNVPAYKKNNAAKILSTRQEGTAYLLYIGKSQTNCLERIDQHIKQDCKNTTYSLKLNAFNEYLKNKKKSGYQFEYGYMLYSGGYYNILYDMEKFLHTKFKPLIGSSR